MPTKSRTSICSTGVIASRTANPTRRGGRRSGTRTCGRRPTTQEQWPGTNDQGPTTKDQRPRTNDQGPTTRDQRPRTNDYMPLLGAHMSVAGGLPRAVERAVVHRCEALQIFAKNANQWRGRVLPPEEIREFRARVKAARIGTVVSHASYLINLAAAMPALRRQSLEA